jgi:hypothetical protein
MSKSEVVERGQRYYNLPREQVIILYRIALWFNCYPFEIRGNRASIARSHEPTLRQLCGKYWSPEFDDHHQDLIDREILKADSGGSNIYVAGRRCKWLPTRQGMQVIEDLFRDINNVYPSWVQDHHSRPPTFRDGEELLEHRKGTMAAEFTFSQVEEYVTTTDIYPRFSIPNRPDLRLFSGADELAYVETQTGHNNAEGRTEKFKYWRESSAPPVVWIFANRTTMVNFWNRLVIDGHIELDGGRFDKPATLL